MSFSLIQILVSTVLVLALAMLTPKVIHHVQETKNKTTCGLTLYRMGRATQQYTDDNDGFLPHEDFGSSKPPYHMCWYVLIDPYFNDKKDPLEAKQDPSYLDLEHVDFSKTGFSYKMNSRLEDYKGTKSYTSPALRHMSTLGNPEQSVLYFDGDVKKHWLNKPYGMYKQVENRHQQKANLLFLDVHVGEHDGGQGNESTWKNAGGLIWDPDAPMDQQ